MTYPSPSSCHFCGARAGQASTLHVPMFRMKGFRGSNQGIVKSAQVEYESAVYHLPRCSSCRRRHRIETSSMALLGLIILLGVASAILAVGGSAPGLAAAAVAVMLLLVGPLLVALLISLPIGAKAKSRRFERRREWPEVRAALISGWQFGDKPSFPYANAWAREKRQTQETQRRDDARARRETEVARRRHVGYLAKAEGLYFDRNVRGLMRMAQSRNLDERAAALPMLGMVEDPAALEALLRLLADPAQLPLHGGAAKALIRYQDPRVVPAIQAAIRALPADGETVSETVTTAKAELLLALSHRSNPDAIMRRPEKRDKGKERAIYAHRSQMYQLYAEGNVPGLLRMAADRQDDDRDIAIRLLGDARDPAALQPLLDLLLDPDEQALHGKVARALIHYDDPRIDPALEAAHEAVGRRDMVVESDLRNALYERAHPPEYMVWQPLSRDEARRKAAELLQ